MIFIRLMKASHTLFLSFPHFHIHYDFLRFLRIVGLLKKWMKVGAVAQFLREDKETGVDVLVSQQAKIDTNQIRRNRAGAVPPEQGNCCRLGQSSFYTPVTKDPPTAWVSNNNANLSHPEEIFITLDSVKSFRRQYLSKQYLSVSRQSSNTAVSM